MYQKGLILNPVACGLVSLTRMMHPAQYHAHWPSQCIAVQTAVDSENTLTFLFDGVTEIWCLNWISCFRRAR